MSERSFGQIGLKVTVWLVVPAIVGMTLKEVLAVPRKRRRTKNKKINRKIKINKIR